MRTDEHEDDEDDANDVEQHEEERGVQLAVALRRHVARRRRVHRELQDVGPAVDRRELRASASARCSAALSSPHINKATGSKRTAKRHTNALSTLSKLYLTENEITSSEWL